MRRAGRQTQAAPASPTGRVSGTGGRVSKAEEMNLKTMIAKHKLKLEQGIDEKIEVTHEFRKIERCSKITKKALMNFGRIYSDACNQFSASQTNVRKKLGASTVAPSSALVEQCAGLLAKRNKLAETALTSCKTSAQTLKKDFNIHKDMMKDLLSVSDTVNKQLNYKGDLYSTDENRWKFFHMYQEQDEASMAPEDCVIVIYCMRKTIYTVDSKSKEEWESGEDGFNYIKNMFIELGALCREVAGDKTYLDRQLKESIFGFDMLIKRSKEYPAKFSTNKAEYVGHAKKVEASTVALQDALVKQKCNNITKNTMGAIKLTAELVQDDPATKEAAAQLYKVSKAAYQFIADLWQIQKCYLPELFHRLQPLMFEEVIPKFLASVDVELYDTKKVLSYLIDRTLADYNSVIYKNITTLEVKQKDNVAVLKRYDLSNRQRIREMLKEIAVTIRVQDKPKQNMQHIFIDNQFLYIHHNCRYSTFDEFVKCDEFRANSIPAVLLCQQVTMEVQRAHDSGIVHGNITSESFYIDWNGIPRIYGFHFARFLSTQKSVRESIYDHLKTDVMAPECADQSNSLARTFAADIFSLSNVYEWIISKFSSSQKLEADLTIRLIKDLVKDMKSKIVASRPTLQIVQRRIDAIFKMMEATLLGVEEERKKAKREIKQIRKEKEEVDKRSKDVAGNLEHFKDKFKGLRAKEEEMRHKMNHLATDINQVRFFKIWNKDLNIPPYWESKGRKGFCLYPIDKASALFQVFRWICCPDEAKSLNQGRDQGRARYVALSVRCVWRIENPVMWDNFTSERMRVLYNLNDKKKENIKMPKLYHREKYHHALKLLPGYKHLKEEVNETYLLHGTGSGALMPLMCNGFNERFTTVALLGSGNYFAEDSGKTDQYVIGDGRLGCNPDLHQIIYTSDTRSRFPPYPAKAYYLLLCRVILGYYVRTQINDVATRDIVNLDNPGAKIWINSNNAELMPVPDSGVPPLMHTALVAEIGPGNPCFREFVQFHADRVYPEYLIMYVRK